MKQMGVYGVHCLQEKKQISVYGENSYNLYEYIMYMVTRRG